MLSKKASKGVLQINELLAASETLLFTVFGKLLEKCNQLLTFFFFLNEHKHHKKLPGPTLIKSTFNNSKASTPTQNNLSSQVNLIYIAQKHKSQLWFVQSTTSSVLRPLIQKNFTQKPILTGEKSSLLNTCKNSKPRGPPTVGRYYLYWSITACLRSHHM